MNRLVRTLVAINIFFAGFPSFAETSPPLDPIYMVLDNGYRGFFARNNEFLEYSVIGKKVKPQDAYHIQVQADPFLGIMLTFATKAQFGPGKNILEAHKIWEMKY